MDAWYGDDFTPPPPPVEGGGGEGGDGTGPAAAEWDPVVEYKYGVAGGGGSRNATLDECWWPTHFSRWNEKALIVQPPRPSIPGGWLPLISVDRSWEARVAEPALSDALGTVHVQECGADGDCMFHAVAVGLHLWQHPELNGVSTLTPAEHRELMMRMRKYASWFVTPSNVNNILQIYGNEWFADYQWRKQLSRPNPWATWPRARETWSPHRFGGTFSYRFPDDESIADEWRKRTVTETFAPIPSAARFLDPAHPDFKYVTTVFPEAGHDDDDDDKDNEDKKKDYSARLFKTHGVRRAIQTAGEVFRGDDNVLDWLVHAVSEDPQTPGAEVNLLRQHDIGFIVLSDLGRMNCAFYPVDRIAAHYMLLYNLHHRHWQLGGVQQSQESGSSMQCVFSATDIPRILQKIYAEDCITRRQDVDELGSNHPMYTEARLKFPAEPQ